MDNLSEARLEVLCPPLADKIRQLALMIAEEPIRVTQGLRSWAEQNALYQQGRTTPGKIVTEAPPGHSWHEFGLAVDVAPFDAEGKPDWNETHPVWQKLITAGESLGMYSGDEFKRHDDPHFQLTGRFPVSPTDEVRQIFANVGVYGVWVEAGLSSL
jgi:peptidoglycan LD-endopeptidase CwlK